jgi:hypothetical protein
MRFQNKILFIIFINLSISFISYSQTRAEILVQKIDKERLKATVDKNYNLVETTLSDDLIYTHSSSVSEDKKNYLNSLQSGSLTYLKIDIIEFNTKQYAKNLVINRGQLALKVSNDQNMEQSFSLKFTDVYEKQKSGWKMVSWQSTRIPN